MNLEIIFSTDSLFHSLSHFTDVSLDVIGSLLNKYSLNDIQRQINMSGSKFYSSFVKSPQELIEFLQSKFPMVFKSIKPDSDGKIRLSFKFEFPIGTSSIIHYAELTEKEKQTIRTEQRNDCIVKTVKVNRLIETDKCQLILIPQDEVLYFCTAFPGELAPPLPRPGERGDIFWDTHLFIR